MYYPASHNRSLMIVLLVAYIIQVDRCSAVDTPPPATDASPPAADATPAATDPTAKDPTATDPTAKDPTAKDPTAKDPTATATDPTAVDDKPSMFNQCKTLVSKTMSDIRVGTGMVLKAIGHAALFVMSALFGAYDGAVLTTAVTGETLAAGLNSVNNVASNVVLVGDVTSGVTNLATGLSTTYRENAEYNINNRQQLMKGLVTRVDNYHPESETPQVPPVANEAGEEVKTAAANEAGEEVKTATANEAGEEVKTAAAAA